MNIEKREIKNKIATVLSVTERALLQIWDAYDDMCYSRYHPQLVMAYGARMAREIVAEGERHRSERERKQALWQLKQNKWIKQRREGDRIVYELTRNGRLAAIEAVLRCTGSLLSDNEWCLVIFDFPEAARRSRQAFRRFLKRVGFERQQLSVWRTKKNVIKETREFINILKIGRWVQIYRGYQEFDS